MVLWYADHIRLVDDTARGRHLDAALSGWVAKNALLQEDQASTLVERQNEKYRWLYVERTLWHGPRTSRTRLSGELKAFASTNGLGFRKERGAAGTAVFEMDYPDGREAVRITLGRQVFVAIIIDDIGYKMDIARRIAALPCKLTMSVMPFTPHARRQPPLPSRTGSRYSSTCPWNPTTRWQKSPSIPSRSCAARPGRW
jgi:hypothetical protein